MVLHVVVAEDLAPRTHVAALTSCSSSSSSPPDCRLVFRSERPKEVVVQKESSSLAFGIAHRRLLTFEMATIMAGRTRDSRPRATGEPLIDSSRRLEHSATIFRSRRSKALIPESLANDCVCDENWHTHREDSNHGSEEARTSPIRFAQIADGSPSCRTRLIYADRSTARSPRRASHLW